MGLKRLRTMRSLENSRRDFISALPDALLIKILSFLPFKTAVRTSTLSKRWTPLCLSLSNLYFKGKKSPLHLITLVDKFLINRNIELSIDKLSLDCYGDYDRNLVNMWLRKAFQHQVKYMSLAFNFHGGYFELLPVLFGYGGEVEVLRLKWRILVDVPKAFCFPRLKVLDFCCVTFASFESVGELLINCPVLEHLVIDNCEYQSGCCLTVCGSALKNLRLDFDEGTCRNNQLKIVIDTRALETLKIEDSALVDIFVQNTLESLRTAFIDVGMERLQLRQSVFELLNNIYHVKFLTLNDKAVGALDESDYKMPIFHNLIKLKICIDNWSCWNLLPKILASSPNLQRLSLPHGVDLTNTSHDDPYGCLYEWPRPGPECFSSSLKKIKFGDFFGTQDEFSLVRYMLLDGKALRKVTIYCSERNEESRIRNELLTGRGSKTCKIVII